MKYLEVKGFVDLAEAAFAQQHEEQVPIVEDGVVVEATLVLVVNPLQLANVQVTLALQLLHFQLQVAVLLLQSVLLQFQDLLGLVVLLDVEVAVQVARLERTLRSVDEVVAVGRVPAGRGARAAAASSRPLPGRSRWRFRSGRLPLAQELTLPVDFLAQGAQFLLSLGQLLESVAVRPVLLERGPDPLRHELAEPQPVLHASRPGLLLLDGRFLDQQLFDNV